MRDEFTLIVGGDSASGQAYADHLRQADRPFVATTRRQEGSGLFLDLARQDTWTLPETIDQALISAAIGSGARCAEFPKKTRQINVDATGALARRLAASGCFSVFLSSTQVFDGRQPFPKEDEPKTPVTEYGRQKAEAEDHVLKTGQAAVLRFTKLTTPDTPLFRDWLENLERGQPITAFDDMVLAPLGRSVLASAIDAVLQSRDRGIYHLTTNRQITYFDAAQHVARRLGADVSLVVRGSAKAAGITAEMTPANACLGDTRLRGLTGIAPPDPYAALDEALGLISRTVSDKRRAEP